MEFFSSSKECSVNFKCISVCTGVSGSIHRLKAQAHQLLMHCGMISQIHPPGSALKEGGMRFLF